MQNKYCKKVIKATIFSVIVAFIIVIIICAISIKIGKEKFQMATDLIDMVTVEAAVTPSSIQPVLEIVEEPEQEEKSTVLVNIPNYREKYATLKISSIGVELPIYYGKTLDLLKNGLGHDNDSYFPGEGGSIILMGHNYKKFLASLPDAQKGDIIEINTNYGDFNYTIYDTQIVEETETHKVPIQKDEEILMIYTCWPINNIGYAKERYVVYAK